MKRRGFLIAAAAAAMGSFKPGSSHAALDCSPYNMYGYQRCTAGISSGHLNTVYARQELSQWCWAACIEMVFRHYGYRIPQSRIVSETWGDIYNLPAQPQHILVNLNRPWLDDNGRHFQVQSTTYTSNAITAAQDLSLDMPLIIGSGSHAMLLTSVTYERHASGAGLLLAASVRDPWPGQGRRYLSPDELAQTHFLARIRIQDAY